MTTKELATVCPESQATIYRLALALDSLLVNGIPFGVLQNHLFQGFLDKTAASLMTELTGLEALSHDGPAENQPHVTAILLALRMSVERLIALLTELRCFPTLRLEELRSRVSQVHVLREECVQRIQELEPCLHIHQPFYQSRPEHSVAAVESFLAELEQTFIAAWQNAQSG